MYNTILETINSFIKVYSTEIIGGLIVSIILLTFRKISDFVKNIRITRIYSGYIGSYYLYSFASSGEDKIIISNLIIKPKLGKLRVIADSQGVYKYRGEMHISERNIYINLIGVNHEERVQLIFHSPLNRQIKNLVGSLNAITVIDEPYSCLCILSDKEISEFNIRNQLIEMGVNNKNSMFIIPKTYSLFFNNIDKKSREKYILTHSTSKEILNKPL